MGILGYVVGTVPVRHSVGTYALCNPSRWWAWSAIRNRPSIGHALTPWHCHFLAMVKAQHDGFVFYFYKTLILPVGKKQQADVTF